MCSTPIRACRLRPRWPRRGALGVPVVVTLDSGELTAIDDIGYGLQRRWFDRRAVAAALRDAARVTVGHGLHGAEDPAGAHRRAVAIVPLGVDPARFPVSRPAEGPPWRLLRVASLNRVKNYPTLLRAVATVAGRGLDVHLDIVGEDTLNGEMQTLARTLGIEPRVTFHGFQPTDALGAFYGRAHLHVVSSRHEAAAVVVLEAAAAGVPTVGTAVGYVADWIPDRAVACRWAMAARWPRRSAICLRIERDGSGLQKRRERGRWRTTRTGVRRSSSGFTKRPPDDRFADRDGDRRAGAAEDRNQHRPGDRLNHQSDATPADHGAFAAGRVEKHLAARVAQQRHQADADPQQRRSGRGEGRSVDEAQHRRREQRAADRRGDRAAISTRSNA